MKKILVITHFLPWPVRQGSWHRNMELLEHFRRRGHRVDLFVAPGRPWARSLVESFPPVIDRLIMSPPTGREGRCACLVGHAANLIRAARVPGLDRLGRKALWAARRARHCFRNTQSAATQEPNIKKPARVPPGLSFTRGQKAHIRRVLDEGDYDTVVAVYTFISPLLEGIPREGRLWLVDTNDCFHQRAQSMRDQGLDVRPLLDYTREEEVNALQGFDVVIAIQEEEADTFREMVPDKKTIHVGMTSSLERLTDRPGHVTIVGADSIVNAEGAVRILRNVWPSVARQHPRAVLDVYGGLGENHAVRAAASGLGNSVVLHGVVDDLRQAYHCDVVLAPLWAGSGLKTKVIEALCYGKPIVTTSIGAQGLTEATGSAMLVADRPEKLAEHLIGLLGNENRRQALANAAYAFAAQRFTPERVYDELDRVLAEEAMGRPVGEPRSSDRPRKGAKVA